MPYIEGEPHWGDADYSPLTPSLRQYTLDLAGWKLEHHVGGWNECNEFSHTHYDNWDAVLPAADIVDMMLENHIMLPNSQTEPFTTAETEEEREKAALQILKIHYNVDSVQELFSRVPTYPTGISIDGFFQIEDWHSAAMPSSLLSRTIYEKLCEAFQPET